VRFEKDKIRKAKDYREFSHPSLLNYYPLQFHTWFYFVIPVQMGIQKQYYWIPAFAGMTT